MAKAVIFCAIVLGILISIKPFWSLLTTFNQFQPTFDPNFKPILTKFNQFQTIFDELFAISSLIFDHKVYEYPLIEKGKKGKEKTRHE